MKVESFFSKNPSRLEGKMIDLFKDGYRPTLGFVFCSPMQDFKEIGCIFDRFGIELLGCTTAGEIVDDSLQDSSIAVMLMDMKREHFGRLRPLTPVRPIGRDALKKNHLKAGETCAGVVQAASRS